MTEVDPGQLLAAAMKPRGLVVLERATGVQSIHLAHQLQRLLDDPDAARRWPREVRVLRERRDARRQARSSL